MLLSEIENYKCISQKNSLFYEILRRWNNNKSDGRKIIANGKIGKFEIRSMQYNESGFKCWNFMLVDVKENTFVGGIELSEFGRNARSWQVDTIGIANKYQGMNLSVALYEWLIKQKNLILITGMSQTPGGKSIWERLAYVSGIFIFGYDVNKKESFQVDQKDLFNEDVYVDELINERDYLGKEYDKIKNQLDNLDPETTPESKFKELEKAMNTLSTKIFSLDDNIVKAEDYLRLVAIKKH